MKFEIFLAKRLKMTENEEGKRTSTPSLNIAIIGMTLAIVIMILSVTVVCGFKQEISNKIYNLDSHIKVRNTIIPYIMDETSEVLTMDVMSGINDDRIKSISLIAEKPVILKTVDNFKGVMYKGVDDNYNWDYINKSLVDGKIPLHSDSTGVVISRSIASQLKVNVNDKIMAYFIDDNVKMRSLLITGIYNTDLEDYDKAFIIGNIGLIQNVNRWSASEGNYIGITCDNTADIIDVAYEIDDKLRTSNNVCDVTTIEANNMSYFTWLELLDMNVIIIIVIMLLVSSFTLISGLLMIVLERINMVGLLKTMGAENKTIRSIFIYLTNKLIIKSLIVGNILGIGFSLLQDKFHFIKLNPEAYYIDYVPIEINWWLILSLNIGIIVISYLSLLAPSHIISKIEPNKSIRFE